MVRYDNGNWTPNSGYYYGRKKPRKTQKYHENASNMIKILEDAEQGENFFGIYLISFDDSAVYLQNHSEDGIDFVKKCKRRMNEALGEERYTRI